jgi:hypothetical protein
LWKDQAALDAHAKLQAQRPALPTVCGSAPASGSAWHGHRARRDGRRGAIQQSVQSSRRCSTARPAMRRSRNAASAAPA